MFFTADSLASPRVAHGFFTRKGGVSRGIYASLNCGFGSSDDKDAVAENRRRIALEMGVIAENLLSLNQVHGTEVALVRKPWKHADRPRADAAVSNRTGFALGILTADCVPVLFADGEAGVIGAAHAGWRGALAGVVEETVKAMIKLGAKREHIAAAVGPAIAQESYEVGIELREQFIAKNPVYKEFFTPSRRASHWLFDIKGFVLGELKAQNIHASAILENDTYLEENMFFSYRRSSHRGEPDYGRQMSVIMLKE